MTAGVATLVGDARRRAEMATAARQAVRDRSWDGVVRVLGDHYRDVMAGRGATRLTRAG